MPVDMQSFRGRVQNCCKIGTQPYREAISYVTERGAESLQFRERQVRGNRPTIIIDDDITR